jgi:hypothetical protein
VRLFRRRPAEVCADQARIALAVAHLDLVLQAQRDRPSRDHAVVDLCLKLRGILTPAPARRGWRR